MENPIKMDDLGVPPIFGNSHMSASWHFCSARRSSELPALVPKQPKVPSLSRAAAARQDARRRIVAAREELERRVTW